MLEEVRKEWRQLETLRERIESLTVLRARQAEFSGSSGASDVVGRYAVRREMLLDKHAKIAEAYIDACLTLERVFSQIQDPRHAVILRGFYCGALSIPELARKMSISTEHVKALKWYALRDFDRICKAEKLLVP